MEKENWQMLITVGILSVQILFPIVSLEKCPSLMEVDQECASKFLYFGKRDAIIVIDEKSYEENCKSYEEGMYCVEEYLNNCLHGVPKIAASVLFKTVVRQYKTRCLNETVRPQFIEHSQCLRNKTILEKFHQCGDRYFAMADQIHKIPSNLDLYAPAACCIMVKFHECVEKNNRELCGDQENHGKFWTEVFDEISGDTLTYCYGYETYDNCQENFPRDIWQKVFEQSIDQLDQLEVKKQRKFRSLYFTNIDLISSLSDTTSSA